MENIMENTYVEFKPIVHTVVFEIKKQWKKFLVFLIFSIALVFIQSYLFIVLFPDSLLSTTQSSFLSSGLTFLTTYIILFASILFFSGMICSEFSDKTGYIIFPKINKYKLILGKYIGSLLLEVSVVGIYYFLVGWFSILYYDEFTGTLLIRYIISFGFAVLYVIAMSSFVVFFSSFLKSVNVTIVVTFIILFIGFNLSQTFLLLLVPDLEPLYSLPYLSSLISALLQIEFPDPNYSDFTVMNFTIRTWITPTIPMGLLILLLYIAIGLILAAYLFKRRQL